MFPSLQRPTLSAYIDVDPLTPLVTTARGMIELTCLREIVCHCGSRVSRDSGAARTITRSDPGCFCYWNGLGNAMSPVIELGVRLAHKRAYNKRYDHAERHKCNKEPYNRRQELCSDSMLGLIVLLQPLHPKDISVSLD
jgi:hypothetical protein